MGVVEIVSTTASDYINEKGIVLEDWQIAWLLYYSGKDNDWVFTALEEIANETGDIQLKEQISFLISSERKKLEVFKTNKGNAAFILLEQFSSDSMPTRQGCYFSYELAQKMAKRLQKQYSIEKVKLMNDEADPAYADFDGFVDDELGIAHFYKDGGLKDIASKEFPYKDWAEHHNGIMFYERYFDFKHPFKTGDILRCSYDDDNTICIIGRDPQMEKDSRGLDYSDSGIYVNRFDRETGIVWDSDTPENPYLFDFLDIPTNTGDLAEKVILEWSSILKGNGGSMQFIQDSCRYLKETYEEDHKKGYITGFQLREYRS